MSVSILVGNRAQKIDYATRSIFKGSLLTRSYRTSCPWVETTRRKEYRPGDFEPQTPGLLHLEAGARGSPNWEQSLGRLLELPGRTSCPKRFEFWPQSPLLYQFEPQQHARTWCLNYHRKMGSFTHRTTNQVDGKL